MTTSPRHAYRVNGDAVAAERFYEVACHPGRSVVVEACAGAGKTWMLVARIVRALLDGTAPHEILAITFTRKAAAEMSNRLNAALRDLAGCDAAARVATLRRYGMSAAEAEAKASAAAALQLHVLSQARPVEVRTFHSWFAQLLRTAPLDELHRMGLPVGADFVEDDEAVQPAAWRRLLGALAASDELTQTYNALVAQVGRTKARQALEAVWAKRAEFQRADDAGVLERSVLPFGEVEPSLAALSDPTDALPPQREQWLAWARALGQQKDKTPQKAAGAIEQAWTQGLAGNALLAALRAAVMVKDEDRIHTHLAKFADAQAAVDALQPLLRAQRQHAAWVFHQRVVSLGRVWLADYRAFKQERALVDMGDLEAAAVHLLGDSATEGWMAERLDARVRHLLVDEFQDTNPLQWQALHGWLSGYAGAGGGGVLQVFLVGDPKQSIYAFRRADPAVFAAAAGFLQQAFGAAHLACDHTRRCSAAVTRAVNAVLGAAADAGEYGGFRAHTTQREAEADEGGDPTVFRLPLVERPAKASVERATDWRDSFARKRPEPEAQARQLEAAQAADLIAHWVHNEGLVPGQVMVLARKNSALWPLAEALRERGIASQAREKALLADTLEVRDLLALLDVLVSPGHSLALAQALKSPLFAVTDDDLMALAKAATSAEAATPATQAASTSAWWTALLAGDWASHPALHRAQSLLPDWAAWVRALPPHDALDAIYHQGEVLARYAAATPASLRPTVLANLRQLLHEALQLDGGRYATPYALVRALRGVNAASGLRLSAAPKVAAVPPGGTGGGGDGGAVQLLTVHGAKGLEASAVLVLDAQPSAVPDSKPFAVIDWPADQPHPLRFAVVDGDKRIPTGLEDAYAHHQTVEAREALNQLYVAMTRAEHQLVFSAHQPGKAPEPNSMWQRVQGHVPASQATPAQTHAASSSVATAPHSIDWPELLPWQPSATSTTNRDAATSLASQMGQALHRLMEWGVAARGVSVAQGEQVAREFLLPPEAAHQVAAAAQRILGSPALQPFFASDVEAYNEVALGEAGRTLRIDRLVKLPNGPWWVLDYKLADAPHTVAAHREQVAAYVRAVQQACPGEPVKGALVSGQGELWVVVE